MLELELKKLVNTLMAERGESPMPTVHHQASVPYYPEQPYSLVSSTPASPTINISPVKHSGNVSKEDVDIQDTEVYVEETLSLDVVEKTMIRKALDRHHGNRKKAAMDLKISERTLYRKIKEYGLE